MILRGDVPSPANPPSGCRFHTRCWLRRELGDPERCAAETPELRVMQPGHRVACHFAEELPASAVVAADRRRRALRRAGRQRGGARRPADVAPAPEPEDLRRDVIQH